MTLRGYHSFDGDQAYRLPILLQQQDPNLYAHDPFVGAFTVFNPHRGYLYLLDLVSRPFGLSTALAGLFALTLGTTMVGIDRLTRAVWPDRVGQVGLIAMVLVLIAKAGNIGTNHLFEATLLDRLVAFALGWLALSGVVADSRRGVWLAAPCLGLATVIHPSVGLQISLTLGVSWLVWSFLPDSAGGSFVGVVGSSLLIGVALVPGLALIGRQSGQLLAGVPQVEFRPWAVEVQGPQHMLPATWRLPQWLAFGSYFVLALLTFAGCPLGSALRRLGVMISVNLFSLSLAYVAVAGLGDLRVTLFQPFRMATLGRGLCLVAVAGRLVGLWERGDLASRGRVILITVGLAGDWMLVVATLVEVVTTLVETWRPAWSRWAGGVVLGFGLIFLSRHDTESGQIPIVAALGLLTVATALAKNQPLGWNRRRRALVLGIAWFVPIAAWWSGVIGDGDGPVQRALVARYRFAEVPVDPAERVAAWCRVHTPASSRFIVPPGEKEFRLWSRRAVAFNRAASPYHALGLLDWAERFRDHVGFTGSAVDFARTYLGGRHNLERNYDRMTPPAKIALAHRQGATHVLERLTAPGSAPNLGPGLELLVTFDRYAVYRVR